MPQPKTIERNHARELRAEGLSIGDIARKIGCSEGSIHSWAKDILLTEQQRVAIYTRTCNHQKASSGARSARLDRWHTFYEEADRTWGKLRQNPEFMFGLALYAGEGDKARANSAGISNCDPREENPSRS